MTVSCSCCYVSSKRSLATLALRLSVDLDVRHFEKKNYFYRVALLAEGISTMFTAFEISRKIFPTPLIKHAH